MKEEKFKKQEEFIEKIRTSNFTRHPFYYILTMGCQLNENDSEKLCGMQDFEGAGEYRRYPSAVGRRCYFSNYQRCFRGWRLD